MNYTADRNIEERGQEHIGLWAGKYISAERNIGLQKHHRTKDGNILYVQQDCR
jgi:hypothetical protein